MRLSKILSPNIGLSIFGPKYEIKCEIEYLLSLLNSFAFDKKMKQKKQMKTIYPNKKKKKNI
jgi:hypothetical protein